jgi:hypothetical protein
MDDRRLHLKCLNDDFHNDLQQDLRILQESIGKDRYNRRKMKSGVS